MRAWTLSVTAFDGPLPGVAMAHTVAVHWVVDRTAPVAAEVSVTWKPVMGELLNAPGIQLSVRLRSAICVIWTLDTGAGLSCTETVTVPHV